MLANYPTSESVGENVSTHQIYVVIPVGALAPRKGHRILVASTDIAVCNHLLYFSFPSNTVLRPIDIIYFGDPIVPTDSASAELPSST